MFDMSFVKYLIRQIPAASSSSFKDEFSSLDFISGNFGTSQEVSIFLLFFKIRC
jgi:hypothetical protein